MNLTYARLDVWRAVRNIPEFFFTAILPLFFYIIFATQSWSKQSLGNGNANMMVMATMAMYGAVIATSNIGAGTAVETHSGWGRQIALTPMGNRRYLITKLTSAFVLGLIPVVLIFLAGIVMGAQAVAWVWWSTAAITVVGSLVFALYGAIFGLTMSARAASGAAAGGMVILAFLGNMFFPLTGTVLAIAKFTPLYGLVSLVRRPVSDGFIFDGTKPVYEPLWISITSVVVWTVIFAALALMLVNRGKARQ